MQFGHTTKLPHDPLARFKHLLHDQTGPGRHQLHFIDLEQKSGKSQQLHKKIVGKLSNYLFLQKTITPKNISLSRKIFSKQITTLKK